MKISHQFDEGESTKTRFKIIGMALKKLYRNTLRGKILETALFSRRFPLRETPLLLQSLQLARTLFKLICLLVGGSNKNPLTIKVHYTAAGGTNNLLRLTDTNI